MYQQYNCYDQDSCLNYHTVHGLLHTQAFGIIHKGSGQTAVDLTHGCQLTAVLPGVCPRAVIQRVANGVIGDSCPIVRSQQILPVAVTVRVVT